MTRAATREKAIEEELREQAERRGQRPADFAVTVLRALTAADHVENERARERAISSTLESVLPRVAHPIPATSEGMHRLLVDVGSALYDIAVGLPAGFTARRANAAGKYPVTPLAPTELDALMAQMRLLGEIAIGPDFTGLPDEALRRESIYAVHPSGAAP